MTPLKGKVAKILSPSAIAINLGIKDGVKIGDEFAVYELGDMINDPFTKEDIEQLEVVKGIVRITHVQDRISIAESYEVKTRVLDVAHFFDPMRREYTEKVAINITKATYDLLKASPVKEGDLVRRTNQV